MEPLSYDCCFDGQPGDALYRPRGKTFVSGIFTIYETTACLDGPSKGVILFLPDGFGLAQHNVIMADWYAAEGYDTLLVDCFEGDPLPVIFMTFGATPNADLDVDFPNLTQKEKETIRGVDIHSWFAKHNPDRIWPLLLAFIKDLRTKRYPSSPLFALGHCFGGKFALRLAKDIATACVVYHPSNLTPADLQDRTRPVFIGCAETDVFTPKLVTDLLPGLKASPAPYHLAIYGGTKHGFASRADVNDPVTSLILQHSFEDSISFLKRLISL